MKLSPLRGNRASSQFDMPMTPEEKHRWKRRIRQSRLLKGAAKQVAWALADAFHNKDTGQCNPSMDTLAAEAGLSETGAKGGVRDLVRHGFLEVEQGPRGAQGRQGSNHYRLTMPPSAVPVDEPAPSRDRGAPSGEEPRGRSASFQGSRLDEFQGSQRAPEPLEEEPSKEPAMRARAQGSFIFGLTADVEREFELIWSIWPRKENRKRALAAYRRARSRTAFDEIRAGIERYLALLDREPDRPALFLSTFLEDERWSDEPSSRGPIDPRGKPPRDPKQDGERAAVRIFIREKTRDWRFDGPTPLEGGCRISPAILAEFQSELDALRPASVASQ